MMPSLSGRQQSVTSLSKLEIVSVSHKNKIPKKNPFAKVKSEQKEKKRNEEHKKQIASSKGLTLSKIFVSVRFLFQSDFLLCFKKFWKSLIFE